MWDTLSEPILPRDDYGDDDLDEEDGGLDEDEDFDEKDLDDEELDDDFEDDDEEDDDDDEGTTSTTKTISTDDLTRGYYASLSVNSRLKFTFCGSSYYIKLTDADNDDEKAAFVLTPGNNGFVLKEGLSEKIDLDSDGVDDILFRLESVSTNRARVYIKRISDTCNAPVTTGEIGGAITIEKLLPRAKESNLTPVAGFLGFGILLCILAIIIRSLRFRRK